MNALNSGALVGFRGNRNRWQIKPHDLSKWLAERSDNATARYGSANSPKQPAVDERILRIAVLEAEVKGKDQRISDLERDRDDWKKQAQELARPRRWWPF